LNGSASKVGQKSCPDQRLFIIETALKALATSSQGPPHKASHEKYVVSTASCLPKVPFFFPLRTNLTFMQDSNVPTEVPAFPDFLILSDAILAKEM